MNRDFYFDDLNFIFQESLRNPGYSGVLLPMAHALFDPAIAAESWYSDEHLRQWLSLDRYSSARWPSPYSPALMQQIAVNLLLCARQIGPSRGIYVRRGRDDGDVLRRRGQDAGDQGVVRRRLRPFAPKALPTSSRSASPTTGTRSSFARKSVQTDHYFDFIAPAERLLGAVN